MVHAYLNETLTQERPIRGAHDGMGGNPREYDAIATVRGRISGNSASERERGGREEAFYAHTLFAEPGADVQRGDRFTRANGMQFVVIAVRQLSGRRPHVEASCDEIRAGR